MKNKILSFVLAVMLISGLFVTNVSAATPYISFNYDAYGNIVESPDIYEPELSITGAALGVEDFINPVDIFSFEQELYILDAGNARIVKLSEDLSSAAVIAITENGNAVNLAKASGMFVNSKNIYVADSGNNCVWICSADGTVIRKITKPDNEYFSQYLDFLPVKVTGDSVGNIYVRCTGVYQGLVIFNKDYEFEGFFGSEMVQTTAQVISDFFWKRFMTSEQRDAMADYVPSEIYNMDMTSDNFLYTITPGKMAKGADYKQSADSIRCLNPNGSDVLVDDNLSASFTNDSMRLNFVDIAYDNAGFINVLDNKQGKIFQFDCNMQLVAAFGGTGDFLGTFRSPCAIATINGRLFVLDSTKSSITVFGITDTGNNIRSALMLYNDGDYEASLKPWLEVIKQNPNFQLAYIGIGNAYYNNQDYKKAMEYYELAAYTTGYSEAFKEYRVAAVRGNIGWIAAAIVVLVVGIKLLSALKKKKAVADSVTVERSRLKMPIYTMFHPINGFDELFYRKKMSLRLSFIPLVLLILYSVGSMEWCGSQFVITESGTTDILKISITYIAVLFVFVVANWAFCVLVDGKAKFKDIWIFSNYSLLPFILCGFIRIVLSHFLVANEGVFLTLLTIVGVAWSFVMLMSAFSVFHEFTISKSILMFVITIIGMALIAILAFLIYSLVIQVYENLVTLFCEIVFRINS